MINPLFSSDDKEDKKPQQDEGYVLRHRQGKTIQPISKGLKPPAATSHAYSPPAHHRVHQSQNDKPTSASAAVELIRRKVAAIYGDEPPAKQEIKEAQKEPPKTRSKHQQFMYSLSTSGKPLAQIQTEWHNYYLSLPDSEKHEVWHEFYASNGRQPTPYASFVQQQTTHQVPEAKAGHPKKQKESLSQAIVGEHTPPVLPHSSKRSAARIKKRIVSKVLASEEAQKKAQQHFRSLLFGISTGVIVLAVLLFGFFNEMIIAPFIQPSRHVNATPIILSSDSVSANETPEVVIPKINVQIPVIYDASSVDESTIQKNLENGVIHYATTVMPGQQGNAAFFGHSSNNIFNKGKYKFAFVLLHEMVPGDIFYLTYNKTIYTYRVFDKRVVPPSEVSVLNNVPGKTATAALITCDPPGTSNNRLVVWGEQISPDPTSATAPSRSSTQGPTELSSNGPTMWSRLWNWIF